MRNRVSGQEVLYFLSVVLLAASMVVCFVLLLVLPESRRILLRIVLFLGALLNLLVAVHRVSAGRRKAYPFFIAAGIAAAAVFLF